MSDKIRPQHVARKAMLYVRQSSAYQVNHNLESQRLQYAMQDRLHHLGWREVDVVDEDLGRSAAGTVTRAGFDRMVAEVCLGNVGGVAAREVSRFARNSREWQHLVEVCRVVDTVLIDLEAVYCPRLSNDRLLLGLKGSLNEYELDLLRQRSVEARRAKAQRGELLVAAPVGFLKTDAPHFEKDPDRRIQEAVALVFQKFGELGTVRQTLSWFLEHGLQLPARSVSGEITWRRPSFGVLYRMLSNPIYGGAYAYGKTESTIRYEQGEPRTSSRRRPREEWLAFIPHAHEGYVSWDEFERNRQTMAANTRAWDHAGPVTRGPALLTGVLRCRRCGRKLVVCYTGNAHNVLRYICVRGARDNGEPRCISFGGLVVDDAIGKEILRVVQPAAVDAAVVASEAAAHQQDEVLKAWTRELEAARYAARRAQKQYDATDPGESPRGRRIGATLEYGVAACPRDRGAHRSTRARPPSARGPHPRRIRESGSGPRDRLEESARGCPTEETPRSNTHSRNRRRYRSRRPVRSFWSFTGKAACIPNCECRDDDAGRVPRTRRRTSSMRYACWRGFVPTICWRTS